MDMGPSTLVARQVALKLCYRRIASLRNSRSFNIA
jgi:hypothetical protein